MCAPTLRRLLSEREYRQAEASVLNAHYTDPGIAAQMWAALRHAGFSGGRVLEPGCGCGTFIGLAPDGRGHGRCRGRPAHRRGSPRALYPDAQIRSEGFETTRVPQNAFVATIGNVPFGDFPVYDPAHNPDRHSIHNYFILKSLALTAPGGYVAVITSRYTMDTLDPRARAAMAATADFLGGVRLPDSAFTAVAGTTVVTDILLFRKRDDAADAAPLAGVARRARGRAARRPGDRRPAAARGAGVDQPVLRRQPRPGAGHPRRRPRSTRSVHAAGDRRPHPLQPGPESAHQLTEIIDTARAAGRGLDRDGHGRGDGRVPGVRAGPGDRRRRRRRDPSRHPALPRGPRPDRALVGRRAGSTTTPPRPGSAKPANSSSCATSPPASSTPNSTPPPPCAAISYAPC